MKASAARRAAWSIGIPSIALLVAGLVIVPTPSYATPLSTSAIMAK
jgi:hypothetical protein